jgi:hypothetical protein
MKRAAQAWFCAASLALLIGLPGCGGGSSSPPPPPPPPALAITTTTIPDATQGVSYNFQLQATGGSGFLTWTFAAGSGPLPLGISMSSAGRLSGVPAENGSFNFTPQVADSAGHSTTKALSLKVILPAAPVVATTVLPDGRVGGSYQVTLAATNGANPLPGGLSLGPAGDLSGILASPGTTSFTVRVTDSAARFADRALSLKAVAVPGRNDTIPTATSLSNGSFQATLSPLNSGGISPDTDYYKLTANPASTVAIQIVARQTAAGNPLDSAIEILDGAGLRFNTCRDPFSSVLSQIGPPLVQDPDPTDFNDTCVNDDDPFTGTTDSSLEFQVPGASGGPAVTFYVHVLNWTGDARPDLFYRIVVSGAN